MRGRLAGGGSVCCCVVSDGGVGGSGWPRLAVGGVGAVFLNTKRSSSICLDLGGAIIMELGGVAEIKLDQ